MIKTELQVRAYLTKEGILYKEKGVEIENIMPYLTTEITGITVENINQFVKEVKTLNN